MPGRVRKVNITVSRLFCNYSNKKASREARFQLEFPLRDGKQHAGLTWVPGTKQRSIGFSFQCFAGHGQRRTSGCDSRTDGWWTICLFAGDTKTSRFQWTFSGRDFCQVRLWPKLLEKSSGISRTQNLWRISHLISVYSIVQMNSTE